LDGRQLSSMKQLQVTRIASLCPHPAWRQFFKDVEESTVITYLDKVFRYSNGTQKISESGALALKGNKLAFLCDNGEIRLLDLGDYNKEYHIELRVDKPNSDDICGCTLGVFFNPTKIRLPNQVVEKEMFGMSFASANIFASHFSSLNRGYLTQRKLFKEKIGVLTREVKINEPVFSFLKKQATRLPKDIFLEKKRLLLFETLLLEEGYIGELCLQTAGSWQASLGVMAEKALSESLVSSSLKEEDFFAETDEETIKKMRAWRESSFSMIREFLEKRRIFKDRESLYFGAWSLLLLGAAEVYPSLGS